MRRLGLLLPLLLTLATPPAAAEAGWTGSGDGSVFSGAGAVPAGTTPTAVVAGQDVAVNWSPVSAGGSPASGYLVRRFDLGGGEQPVGAGCAGVMLSTSCDEGDVPPGDWVYRVTALRANWVGPMGPSSNTATVLAPATEITTSAWSIGDRSSGSLSNAPDPTAFADGVLRTTSSVPTSFSPSRYLQFDLAPSLDPAASVSGASFDFRFSASGGSRTICFYFDLRSTSTGAVLATHGSSGAPVGCVTGTTLQTISTSLPTLTSGAVANDLSVRVYLRSIASGTVRVDMGTVSGSTGQPLAFTLYERGLVDSTSGTAATVPWSLWTADSTIYQSAANWTAAFNASRYLDLGFPSYVPAGSSVSGASLRHSYNSATAGTTCWYFALYAGPSLIGTHGSASSPISCTSSTSTYVTDTVALPELDTAAEANSASIRLYVRNSSSRRSRHNVVNLDLGYAAP